MHHGMTHLPAPKTRETGGNVSHSRTGDRLKVNLEIRSIYGSVYYALLELQTRKQARQSALYRQ